MRFVHTADNHLDMPLTSLSPEKAVVRRAQRLSSFSKIIDYTIEHGDMLLISGDLFHSSSPSESVSDFCNREFARLDPIPVFISLGNHDYGAAHINFPGNVHVFPPHAETVIYKDCAITGASFSSASDAFADRIPAAQTNGLFNILCIHGDITANSSYNPLNKDSLLNHGYDYIALGHIHEYTKYKNIFYPGCHDGSGFDEEGEKSFIYCDASKAHMSVKTIASSSLIYRTKELDISDFSSSVHIANALMERFPPGIYKFNLVGNPKDDFVPNTDAIETYISSAFFSASVQYNRTQAIDHTESILYKLFSEYITTHCDEETASLALNYGISALKGDALEWR